MVGEGEGICPCVVQMTCLGDMLTVVFGGHVVVVWCWATSGTKDYHSPLLEDQ